MKKRKKRSQARSSEANPVEWSAPDGRLPSPDHDLASQSFGAFWSIWDRGAWRDLAHGRSSTGYAKEEGEAILKTSSTTSTRPAKLQLDRAEKSTVKPEKCCFPLDFPLTLNLNPLVFWSILEHMGHEEHGGTWHMDAAQLDTQRKKGEAILKTSSTIYSTNRSSSSTRPAKLQLDRAEKSKSNPKNVASPLTFL
ncbi:unnamed protein product [Microthlaspi erraticum]|uniref:Uncharacterized protein n=1 Tax=Microthlaspi erraticum TaxID=1685480 RepID=A0A6D2I1U7_9BRAS|nr:unnamed protein product [Microthlaspi erraticum]